MNSRCCLCRFPHRTVSVLTFPLIWVNVLRLVSLCLNVFQMFLGKVVAVWLSLHCHSKEIIVITSLIDLPVVSGFYLLLVLIIRQHWWEPVAQTFALFCWALCCVLFSPVHFWFWHYGLLVVNWIIWPHSWSNLFGSVPIDIYFLCCQTNLSC